MAKAKQNATAEGQPTIESFVATIEELERRAETEKQCKTQAAQVEYVQILKRDVAGLMKRDDAKRLEQLVRQLGLSLHDLRSDRAAVEAALNHTALHERKAACAERVRATREAKVATRKTCEQQIEQAEKAQSQAEGDYYPADQAAHELHRLRQERPQLFDDSNPPRLRA